VLRKSSEQSPLLGDKIRSSGKGINHILWKRKAHYHDHKSQLLDSILSSWHQSISINPLTYLILFFHVRLVAASGVFISRTVTITFYRFLFSIYFPVLVFDFAFITYVIQIRVLLVKIWKENKVRHTETTYFTKKYFCTPHFVLFNYTYTRNST
jgi:hypothetical protein